MATEEKIQNTIKATVKNYFTDAEVLLFGSRARETSNKDSDFDILVITHKTLTAKDKLFYKAKIRKELLYAGIRTDILIQSNKEVKKKKDLPGHIIRNILNDAVPLWEKKKTFDIDLKSLTDFGVSVRYPDDFFIPEVKEALEYRDIALEIKSAVYKLIQFNHSG